MTIKPIKTERDYRKALKEIEKLWDAKPNTPRHWTYWSLWWRRMSKSTIRSTLPIRSKPSQKVSHGTARTQAIGPR